MMGKNGESGFSLLEIMTAVAIMGVLVAMAAPSMLRMRDRQETRNSATQMAGLLADARAHAMAEGTPHLVYFNAPTVDGNGACGAAAVEVKDVDHSYSITAGDVTNEFRLPSSACNNVKQYSGTSSDGSSTPAPVPMPREDLAARAPDAAEVGAVASTISGRSLANTVAGVTDAVGGAVSDAGATVGGLIGSSGEGSSGSSGEDNSGEGSSSGSGKSGSVQATPTGTTAISALEQPRSATVAETVVNGATFPVDGTSGRPVIAFSELGIPVDPANPNAWGSGAGGIYLTDTNDTAVFAALVEPLGDVKLRAFDPASQSWK